MTRRFGIVLIVLAAALHFGASGARGQTAKDLLNIINPAKAPKADAKPAGAAEQVPWVKEQIADSKALIEKFQTPTFQAEFLAAGLPAEKQADLLDTVHETLHSYESSLETLTAIANSEKALASDAPQPEIPVPGNADEAADVRTGISKASASLQNTEADKSLLQSLCDQAASTVDAAKQAYDRAVENKQAATDDAAKAKAAMETLPAGYQLKAANAQLYLYKWRLYRDSLTATELGNYIVACRAALSLSEFDVSLDKTDIAKRIDSIKAGREELAPQIKAAIERRIKLEAAVQQAADARNALQKPADDSSNDYASQAARLDQRLQTATEALRLSDDLVDGLQVLSTLYGAETKAWQQIQKLKATHSVEFLQQLNDEATSSLGIFAKLQPIIQQTLQTTHDLQDHFKQQIADSNDTALTTLCQNGMQVAGARINNLNDMMEELDVLQDIASGVLAKTSSLLLEQSWRVRLSAQVENAKASLSDTWHTQLIKSGDIDITVASIVKACVGLVIALILARFLSSLVSNIVSSKLRVGVARAAFIEKWVNYFFSIVFILCVLSWLHIPLTVFAFLGGALAIGVGFGAQNLVNNFISGLILLLEHHIKVGDLVVVDGNQGRVTHLGARFSSIRKSDGVELLVPNSYLLEKTVINWTLSDPRHRYDFTVGVAYGTDTGMIMELFKRALEESPEVIRDPEPKVYFEAFGDNALIFRLYYWLAVDNVDTLQVGSDIRMRIDRDCRAAGVEIAYPQLDVHLHAAKAISLRMERPPTAPGS